MSQVVNCPEKGPLTDEYLEKMNAYWAGLEGGVPDEATERR